MHLRVPNSRPDSGFDDSFLGSEAIISSNPDTAQAERKASIVSSSSFGTDEEKANKYKEDGMCKIQELIQTERNYIKGKLF